MNRYFCFFYANSASKSTPAWSNLLTDNEGNLKLADFDLARSFSSDHNGNLTNRVITLWYMYCSVILSFCKVYIALLVIVCCWLFCWINDFQTSRVAARKHKIWSSGGHVVGGLYFCVASQWKANTSWKERGMISHGVGQVIYQFLSWGYSYHVKHFMWLIACLLFYLNFQTLVKCKNPFDDKEETCNILQYVINHNLKLKHLGNWKQTDMCNTLGE